MSFLNLGTQFMGLKFLKSRALDESVARRVFFRIFLFASVLSIIPIVHILSNSSASSGSSHLAISHGCFADRSELPRGSYLFQGHFLNPIWDLFESDQCNGKLNLTISAIKELTKKKLLNYGAKSLYVGEGMNSIISTMKQLGFSNVVGLNQLSINSAIDYKDKSFDFVFSREVGNFSGLALHVVELERVLKNGGIGALIYEQPDSAVSSLLKRSSVVQVGVFNKFKLLVFKKMHESN